MDLHVTCSVILSFDGTVFTGILWKCVFGLVVGACAAVLDHFALIDAGEDCSI